MQVEYTEPVEADNVVFLQQGYTRNIYGTSEVGITYDTFPSCKLSWSLDGESWTDVANYSDSDVNIVYVFSSPVTLKYIRMTYTGNDLSGTGFAAREFDVNFEKHDISASFISNPNLNESYQGYERLPYGLDMTVSYKNLRTGAESTSVPTAISKYKVTLSSVGNSIYNPVNVETTMTVQDSASNLKVDFEALLNNGSICSALNSDELDEIIYRYENCLSTDELDLLAVMEFENSDGDQMLVVDALNYAIARIEANKNSLNNIFANDSANNAASIAVIASISVVILGVAFLYLKVKKSKE